MLEGRDDACDSLCTVVVCDAHCAGVLKVTSLIADAPSGKNDCLLGMYINLHLAVTEDSVSRCTRLPPGARGRYMLFNHCSLAACIAHDSVMRRLDIRTCQNEDAINRRRVQSPCGAPAYCIASYPLLFQVRRRATGKVIAQRPRASAR